MFLLFFCPYLIIYIFSIPENKEKKRLWVKSLKLQVENLKPNNKVCALHFMTSDYIMSTDRKLLLSNSIPKIAGSNENEVEM